MRLKWTVEFEVESLWVADGFVLTDELAQDMIENSVPFAYPEEVGAKVIAQPSAEEIRKAQEEDDDEEE